jgi:hypothetical protein
VSLLAAPAASIKIGTNPEHIVHQLINVATTGPVIDDRGSNDGLAVNER